MGDITRETLQYAVDLSQPPVVSVGGKDYSTKTLYELGVKERPKFEGVAVSTLTGFADYATSNKDAIPLGEAFCVAEYDKVTLYSPFDGVVIDGWNVESRRDTYITAKAIKPDTSRFGQWSDTDAFIIWLQSGFAPNEHRDALIKYLSHLELKEGVQVTDDGASQTITAKTGVVSLTPVTLPNPVLLKPYRTFREVEPVETQFVLRLDKNGRCALFEADGGLWRTKTLEVVKAWLVENLNGTGITVIG